MLSWVRPPGSLQIQLLPCVGEPGVPGASCTWCPGPGLFLSCPEWDAVFMVTSGQLSPERFRDSLRNPAAQL